MPEEKEDYDGVISRYYEGERVKSIIQMKVETKDADVVADKISKMDEIEDLFLVTGDTDLVAKVSFENYSLLKKFIVDKLSKVEGVKDTKTLMVVTSFKERGKMRPDEQKG